MKDFTRYLQAKDLSKASQKIYAYNAGRFLAWLASTSSAQRGAAPESCGTKDILRYLEHLKKRRKQANATRKYNLYALQHYFAFLQKTGRMDTNPTALIKIRGTKTRKLQKIYSPQQLEQLYDDYHHVFITNYDENRLPQNTRLYSRLSRQRNYVMLGFLVYQGLATREFDRLTLADIDFTKATVKARGRTRANHRTLPLVASQIGVLMHYIQNTRPQFLDFCRESDNLFFPLPSSGRDFTKSPSLERVFKPIRNQLRTLDPDFKKIQQLRASRITHWLKTEGLRKTQYLAGHKTIVSTEQYLPNDLEQLTNDIGQYNPF